MNDGVEMITVKVNGKIYEAKVLNRMLDSILVAIDLGSGAEWVLQVGSAS